MKMQSTTKHRKSRKHVRVEEMKDRISSLPNEILCHILSLLPTKCAVGTCILSTRWKYLWTSLPNLDFDDLLLYHGKRLSPRIEKHISSSKETLSKSFASFVDRVLILRNVSYIRRFRLHLQYLDKNYECSLNTWICAALWRNVQEIHLNVQELDLSFRHIDSKVLPRGLFSCGTLVSLKLFGMFALDVPASVCLPKLKTLNLGCIIFRDNDSTQMLFSSCPVLEELHISSCRCEELVFNISALALKRLFIYHNYDRHDDEYKFIIDSPRLEYVDLTGSVGEVSLVSSVGSLIEAALCVEDNNRDFELIRVISNVKVLRISGETTGAILSSDHELPVFPNLTHLELCVSSSMDLGWELLPDLLQNSPNLESLLLWPARGIKEFKWRKLERVPHCLLHHLKTIEIRAFVGRKQDLKVVEYFLKTAKVLQKLIIDNSPNYCLSSLLEEEESKISTELLMFPRRSKTCQVVFTLS